MKSYAVVFSYNFDSDVAMYLFDTQEEAIKYLEQSIKEEFWIDVDENGWSSSYDISDDGLYGIIKNHFLDRVDVTEVRVGSVYLPSDSEDADLTVCGEHGCDGCLFQHLHDIELCRQEAQKGKQI